MTSEPVFVNPCRPLGFLALDPPRRLEYLVLQAHEARSTKEKIHFLFVLRVAMLANGYSGWDFDVIDEITWPSKSAPVTIRFARTSPCPE